MKQVQRQQLQQKLSPQQIQLMRLLQLPVTDLEMAIKEEIEKNPLLDAEPPEEETLPTVDNDRSDWDLIAVIGFFIGGLIMVHLLLPIIF